MELIFSAALCSVLVSVLLKISKAKGLDPFQMIAWNYAVASVLSFIWFKPNFIEISISQIPWWLIIILSIILPSIFFFLSKSLETAGILKTEIAQRLSVVLSLFAAFLFFNEAFNYLKMLGIGLGIVAIIGILWSKSHLNLDSKNQSKATLYLVSVWVGYATVDILLKYIASLGLKFSITLNLMFIFSFIFTVVFLILRSTTWSKANFFAGSALGALNFANIALYIQAHMILKDSPSIVFAGMNILVVVLGVVAGLVIFKERINLYSGIGLLCGIVGLICLSISN